MTQEYTTSLECVQCKSLNEVTLWNSINVTLDPELKAALFRAEIHQYECVDCNAPIRIDKALMYHDMENQICVQYYPPECLNDPEFYSSFSSMGEITSMESMGKLGIPIPDYLCNPHIVFDMNEMLRFITFRDKLLDTS